MLAFSLSVTASGYSRQTVTPEQGESVANLALEYAAAGVPFQLGGQLTVDAFTASNAEAGQGIDASGLVVNVCREVLGDLRWAGGGGEEPLLVADVSSSTLFNWNTIPVKLEELLPGDLIFFKSGNGRVTGVGIFLERQGDVVHFVVASAGKGQVIKTFLNIRNQYWQESFAGAGRLTYWQ